MFRFCITSCICASLLINPIYAQESDSFGIDENALMAAEAELAAAEEALLAELKRGNKAPQAAAQAPQQALEVNSDPIPAKSNTIITQKSDGKVAEKTVARNIEAKPETPKTVKVAAKPKKAKEKASSQIQKEVQALENKLDSKEKNLAKLQKQLRRTRDQLMVAETEIERLSLIIDENNKKQLQKIAPSRASLKPSQPTPQIPRQQVAAPAPKKQVAAGIIPAKKVTSDMPIVTITVDKANLRTGPGKNNSPLMQVGKGTRLAVETRVGEWFRIITPTGSRAWVSSDVVRFGKTLRSSPTRTIKIRGYSSVEEDEAFEFIKNSS